MNSHAPNEMRAALAYSRPTTGCAIMRRMDTPSPNYRLWSQQVGYYAPATQRLPWAVWDDFGGGVIIYVRAGRLYLSAPFGPWAGEHPLRAADDADRYCLGADNLPVHFLRDDVGYVRALRVGARHFALRPRWHAPDYSGRVMVGVALLVALAGLAWRLTTVVYRTRLKYPSS
ncbi:MAG: hypothetical protein ACLFTK_17440 [Anaerolineales bacterium]